MVGEHAYCRSVTSELFFVSGSDRSASFAHADIHPGRKGDENGVVGEPVIGQSGDGFGAVRRRPAVIQPPHVVNEAGAHMRIGEALLENGHGRRALGAVTEDRNAFGGILCHQPWNLDRTTALVEANIAKPCHALTPERDVRVLAHLDGVDFDIREVLGEDVGGLSSSPAGFDQDFNAEPLDRVDDQGELGVEHAAGFVGFTGKRVKYTLHDVDQQDALSLAS